MQIELYAFLKTQQQKEYFTHVSSYPSKFIDISK